MATAITEENVQKTVFEALPQFGVDEAADHARGDVRGPRRRLARPRRALADHRGRVRRGPQGRRRRQDQDRRRRDRPGGAAGFMSREVVITGVGAVTPLGVGARTLHERWSAGVVGIADGKGAATRVRAHRAPLGQGGAPRRPLHPVRARRGRRGAGRGRLETDELPYDGRPHRARILGTGIGGIGTLERGKELLIESGPKKVPPLSVPLMMSNAAAARGLACATSCSARATASSPPARAARTPSAPRR